MINSYFFRQDFCGNPKSPHGCPVKISIYEEETRNKHSKGSGDFGHSEPQEPSMSAACGRCGEPPSVRRPPSDVDAVKFGGSGHKCREWFQRAKFKIPEPVYQDTRKIAYKNKREP